MNYMILFLFFRSTTEIKKDFVKYIAHQLSHIPDDHITSNLSLVDTSPNKSIFAVLVICTNR